LNSFCSDGFNTRIGINLQTLSARLWRGSETKPIQSGGNSLYSFEFLKPIPSAGHQKKSCIFQLLIELIRKAFSFTGLKSNNPLKFLITQTVWQWFSKEEVDL
jgi:hypothetical protein